MKISSVKSARENIKSIVNDRLLRALRREPIDKTPIWLMRQAGRYLPEYREIRKKTASFLALCQNPELASEVTLQPLARFPLDAAIIFSDILTIPDALGLGLYFVEGEGPCFKTPVTTLSQVEKLPILDPEVSLGYVMSAIRLTKKALNFSVPLIGFAGSPWSVAAYMTEGRSSKTFSQLRKMMYENPDMLHKLLEKITTNTVLYLQAQIQAGADCIMVFDTWGGLLSPQNYLKFSLHYMKKIVKGVKEMCPYTPITLFTKNGGLHVEAIADSGCDGIGVDWAAYLHPIRQKVGHKVALQGNLDPAALYGTLESIESSVASVLKDFGKGSGHIFNLGHGIHPDIMPEKVEFLVNTVHSLSAAYHHNSTKV